MQATAGWSGDPLSATFKARSTSLSSSLSRRQSLEQGRTSFEATPLERTLSCSSLPEPKLARFQRQQIRAQRGHINAAAAVAVREVEQDACESSIGDVAEPLFQDFDLSEAQRDQLEQDRVSLELAWNKRRNEAERQEQDRQESLPESGAELKNSRQQRALLAARWSENKQVLPQQKRRNAASRSTSSNRARRRAQSLIGSAAQRTQTSRQQRVIVRPRVSSSSFLGLSPDEQLLERLSVQLTGARSKRPAVLGFLESLGKTPLLTKQQEAALTTIVRKGVLLDQKQELLQDQLGRAPTDAELSAETACSPSDYAKALSLASQGKELMMRYNLRLVYSIAKQHVNKGLELDDLLPEGVIGLEKAIEKFEPEKGFRFSTYSHWWIRQHIHRALVESRIIRLPVNVVDSIARINNARRRLAAQADRNGRTVTDDELSCVLGLPIAKVKQLSQLAQPIKSLDMPLYHDDDSGEALHERVASDKGTTSEEEALGAQTLDIMEDDMTALLQTLPVRERNVIRWRYGLRPDGKSLGLSEVAAAYGLTQERIRQIEESGLAHMRERSPAHMKNRVLS